MHPGAGVESLQSLQEWYAALTVFRTDALDALASVTTELNRLEGWLSDQLRSWQRAARDREDDVAQAKNELRARQFPDWSGHEPDTTVQEDNLREAERRLEFAREQIHVVRHWMSQLPVEITELYEGPSRHLASFLEAELPRAIAVLARQMDAVEQYLQVHAPQSPPPPRKTTP